MGDEKATVVLPHFKFNLSQHRHPHFGWIVVGNKKIHRINCFEKFYSSLGYTSEQNKIGLSPDEFIWERFNKDYSAFSHHCLQAHISFYLHEQSDEFREKYGALIKDMIGKCTSDKLNNADDHCLRCYQHPHFSHADFGRCSPPSSS